MHLHAGGRGEKQPKRVYPALFYTKEDFCQALRNGSIACEHPPIKDNMYMSYTSNPRMPRVRMDAVK